MPRPDLGTTDHASATNYTIGPLLGTPTKIIPTGSLQLNGYGSGNDQPTAQELNYILSKLPELRRYHDSLEALNFVAQGAKFLDACLQGIAYVPSTRLHFAWGERYELAGPSWVPSVWSSIDAGHNWTLIYEAGAGGTAGAGASGTDMVKHFSGKYACSPQGEIVMLGTNATQPLGLRHNIMYKEAGTAIVEATIGFKHGNVKYVPAAAKFLIASKPVAVTGMQTLVPTGSTFGFCSVASQRTADMNELAVGSAYVLIADTDGWMWRAPADLAGGFLPIGAAAVLPGIVYLEWMPGHNAFIAITRVSTTYHIYRSADGSVWTETGNLGAAFPPAILPIQTDRMQWAVSGTTLHMLANNHASGVRYYRGFTNDFGVQWRFMALNMSALDRADEQRYPSLHAPANDDRVLCLMSSTNAGAGDTSDKDSDTAGSLRLPGI